MPAFQNQATLFYGDRTSLSNTVYGDVEYRYGRNSRRSFRYKNSSSPNVYRRGRGNLCNKSCKFGRLGADGTHRYGQSRRIFIWRDYTCSADL